MRNYLLLVACALLPCLVSCRWVNNFAKAYGIQDDPDVRYYQDPASGLCFAQVVWDVGSTTNGTLLIPCDKMPKAGAH